MTTAFVMFSGGLDSILAAFLMREQGLKTVCVSFTSAFFSAEGALRTAASLGFETLEVDITDEHLDLVKNPPHGYGKNMNPCIDCHAMMFRKACSIIDSAAGDFIVSGEVLDQRPMSQNMRALGLVRSIAGAQDLLLRPLSARLLEPTPMELDGRVDRDKLKSIQGRGRKQQMEMAASFGINDYPSPAGGCRLTDPCYSRRLKDLFIHQPECAPEQVNQLSLGRHFRLPQGAKLIITRNGDECERLLSGVALPNDLLMEAADTTGPVGIMPGAAEGHEELDFALSLFSSYLKEESRQIRLFTLQAPDTFTERGIRTRPQPLGRDETIKFLLS